MDDRDPLPENWAELDSARSYFEAVREIGRRVKAGEIELPEMFREREGRDAYLSVMDGFCRNATDCQCLRKHKRIGY